MFRRKKDTVKPNLPKEYVWALDINGEDHEYKCLVTEDEVITYEDGREHKHLKVMDHTCAVGVLQIDCETKLFGEMVGFQLERYIPYVKLANGWAMSDTTREDRLQEQVAIYRKQSKWEYIIGGAMILVNVIAGVGFGLFEDTLAFSVIGMLFIVSGAYQMIRVKQELGAIREAQAELENEDEEMKAYLEDKTPVFRKKEEE